MNHIRPNPFLQFDFVDENNIQQQLIFLNPIKTFEVQSITEIYPTLCEIQNEISKGFYAAGFITYEAAAAFDPAFSVADSYKLPLLWFGIFREPVQACDFFLQGFGYHSHSNDNSDSKPFQFTKWESTVSRQEYNLHIQRIKDAIRCGETYQVNYTMRLRSNFSGDDFAFYQYLRSAQQGHYAAYLDIGRYHILSASPELFFSLKDQQIITRPMKGTAKRGRWYEEDRMMASWLATSEKNKAENVMIVDLLRNDMGRIAEIGSVNVPVLFDIECYPTVFQMTSTVTGQIRTDTTLADILKALFPCGSITGAPKIRTMRIISELENTPREIYCGTIGFVKPNGNAVFNVAIRTMLVDCETGIAEYGVGGGITWDSSADDEYAEALTKAALLTVDSPAFDLLETLKWEHGKYILLDRHLQRLNHSAHYFAILLDMHQIEMILEDHANAFSADEVRRVRLLVSQSGEVRVESTPLIPTSKDKEPLPIFIARSPISKNNRFFYHKTTHRSMYDVHRSENEHVFDVLLWNEDEEITEFINGNVVIQIGEQKLTPPIECGLLPGTFRAELLAEGLIQEKVITLADLQLASQIWFINSVRGWVPVKIPEGVIGNSDVIRAYKAVE